MQVILASQSPARLAELRRAGLEPIVHVSHVDESAIDARDCEELVALLATAKARAVRDLITIDQPTVLIGCDSILEFQGRAYGKPGSATAAVQRWRMMRGSQGMLHTGHHIRVIDDHGERAATRIGTTAVHFADLSDAEIAAYVASGEPSHVAGAFTIDGLGGAFITRVEGDPHNVVGISLPLVRQTLLDLGVSWHELWATNEQP